MKRGPWTIAVTLYGLPNVDDPDLLKRHAEGCWAGRDMGRTMRGYFTTKINAHVREVMEAMQHALREGDEVKVDFVASRLPDDNLLMVVEAVGMERFPEDAAVAWHHYAEQAMRGLTLCAWPTCKAVTSIVRGAEHHSSTLAIEGRG